MGGEGTRGGGNDFKGKVVNLELDPQSLRCL